MQYPFLVAVLLLVPVALPQDAPDYSGKWKLEIERSRLDDVPKPKELTLDIAHKEPELNLVVARKSDQGDTSETFRLTTKGVEQKDTAGGTATARAWWDQGRLHVELKRGGEIITRRMTVVAGAKMLTSVLTVKTSAGEKKGFEFFAQQ